jgi:hypothetical protein
MKEGGKVAGNILRFRMRESAGEHVGGNILADSACRRENMQHEISAGSA